MLTKEYEMAYISSFTKVFKVLNESCDLYVKPGECENYEIEVRKINDEVIKNYLSICYQKQNGSLTIVADKKIDDNLLNELVKYVSLALNENVLASYNFKDLSDYIVFHFEYVKQEKIIDNKKLIEDMYRNGEIENVIFDTSINPLTM